MAVNYQRIGCGGQCPVNGLNDSSIGFIPNKNKLIAVNSSVKVAKGVKKKFDTGIIYLSPYWSFDGSNNLCPSASPGCRSTCLVTSGQLKNPTPKQSQLDKTNFWLTDPNGFLSQAHKEIESLVRTHDKPGKNNFCIRLNGTSDIPFERKSYTYRGVKYASLMEAFPDVQFYDYTKIYDRLGKTTDNYHLTFSASETNTEKWKQALQRGFQVAMVFGSQPGKVSKTTGKYIKKPDPLPKKYQGFEVIDGDDTDLTFTRPNGVIIGLRMKGKAENDTTGFVKRDFKEVNTNYPKANPKTNIPNVISPRSSKPFLPFINKEIETKNMPRFKKGSAEAKAYMAKLRRKKDSVGKIDRVNRRANTTYVHISRKPKKRTGIAVKKASSVVRKEKTTLMPLRNLLFQDTYTLGKTGKIIYERGYKIPGKDAYEAFMYDGKKVIHKGSVKVNLIDESGISGYVHTKKRGTKSTIKYTRLSGTENHTDTNSHNYKISIGSIKSDSIKQLEYQTMMLNGLINTLPKYVAQSKNKNISVADRAEYKKYVAYAKKEIVKIKKMISLLKKSI